MVESAPWWSILLTRKVFPLKNKLFGLEKMKIFQVVPEI